MLNPAMYEQIDALIEGELVEWSIDYFQELSLNTSNRIERRRFILNLYALLNDRDLESLDSQSLEIHRRIFRHV